MSTPLTAGDPIPSVGLRASDGFLLNLRSWFTKQPVVLVFFGAPTLKGAARRRGMKAIEALAAGHERLREAGIAVAGVSTDSEEQQAAFVKKHDLPFLLLSDERRTAVGLLKIDTVADGDNINVTRPVALVVDRDGIIRDVIDPVEPDELVERTMRALSEPMPSAGDASAAAG